LLRGAAGPAEGALGLTAYETGPGLRPQ